MRVKCGYTVVLGVRVGEKSMVAALRYKTLYESAKHNHLYLHYTLISTSHIKLFRSVFASFVRIIDSAVISPL